MISLFRLSRYWRAASASIVLIALASCATAPPPAPPVCAASEDALRSAEAWYFAPERAALTSPSYTAILDRENLSADEKQRNALRSLRIETDLAAATDAIDRLDNTYSAVETCHLAAMRGLRARFAASGLTKRATEEATGNERRALLESLAGARVAAARATALAQIYAGEAENWASAHPAVQAAVIRASAVPHPAIGYKVTDRGTIYAAADIHSGAVAPIRKGQRVSGPAGVTKPGWVTLELNDGSLGYVLADVVQPVPLNPSALRRFGHRSAASADPIVAALLSARRDLPEKTQVLAARLDAGSEAADDMARIPDTAPSPTQSADTAASGAAPAARQ